MDDYFSEHIKDLSRRAYKTGLSTFTEFLSVDEQNEVNYSKNDIIPYEFYGGTEGCERKLIRFGSENTVDVLLPFPISIILVKPLNIKFAEKLTHRDYLGALMNLGIERSFVGDIIVRDNLAYIFVIASMAELICNDLTKVRHTSVSCELCDSIPEGELYKTENKSVIVTSMRADCIICAVFNLSRTQCKLLFEGKKVYADSRLTENPDFIPKAETVISVRGYGRFRIKEITGNTKKGRTVLSLDKYI